MAAPPVLVGIIFLVAVLGALAFMAYIAWKGSKPSEFFTEAVQEMYQLELSTVEIDAYFELKDKLQERWAPETIDAPVPEPGDGEEKAESWIRKVPADEKSELKKALVRRMLACIAKLEQVQNDKPGNWKLWQSKLVSERYWNSLREAEAIVGQEMDNCIAEAGEIEPGMEQQIFPQVVHLYRLQKQQEAHKQMQKQEKKDEKKAAQKEVKQAELEKRKEIEELVRQERAAQKAAEKLLAEEEKASKGKPKSAAGPASSLGKAKVKKK